MCASMIEGHVRAPILNCPERVALLILHEPADLYIISYHLPTVSLSLSHTEEEHLRCLKYLFSENEETPTDQHRNRERKRDGGRGGGYLWLQGQRQRAEEEEDDDTEQQ